MTYWPRFVLNNRHKAHARNASHSNRLKRTKMRCEFRWFDFYQIGFYELDYSIAHVCRQRIDYRGMD